MAEIKIYKGARRGGEGMVTVDDTPLKPSKHPLDNRIIQFDWGKRSPGAERLAQSILSDSLVHLSHRSFGYARGMEYNPGLRFCDSCEGVEHAARFA